jgi:hypothetical protein
LRCWISTTTAFVPSFTPLLQVHHHTSISPGSVSEVMLMPLVDTVISGSWDKTIRVHSTSPGKSSQIISVPEKIFSMDIHEYTLLVGMANRLNYVYDIRKLDVPVQLRDSSLKFMTRCLKLTPKGDGLPPQPPLNILSLELSLTLVKPLYQARSKDE